VLSRQPPATSRPGSLRRQRGTRAREGWNRFTLVSHRPFGNGAVTSDASHKLLASL